MKTRLILLALPIAIWSVSARGEQIWYVDAGARGAYTGMGWEDAFYELQFALAVAQPGDQIWVAAGKYRPDFDMVRAYTADRWMSFQLLDNVSLYGGFDGTETSIDQRAGLFEQTILTGDLAGNDGSDFQNYGENSLHVVRGDEGEFLLDGFTIVSGQAEYDDRVGQGVLIEGGSLILRNCIVARNNGRAVYSEGGHLSVLSCEFVGNAGGAINNWFGQLFVRDTSFDSCVAGLGGAVSVWGDAEFHDCEFIDNQARSSSSYDGGGAIRAGSGRIVIDTCSFAGNSARYGGAINNHSAQITIRQSSFTSNSATTQNASSGWGGAIYTRSDYDGSVTLEGCSFTANTADSWGSALALWNGRHEVIDCAFEGNSGGSTIYNGRSEILLSNSVFRDNYGARGGALHQSSRWASADVRHCAFINNSAIDGGAITSHGPVVLKNSLIVGNTATTSGAIQNDSQLTLQNCLLYGNTATTAGGVYHRSSKSHSFIINSILWNNVDDAGSGEPSQISWPGGCVDVNYSCVEGWTGALGGVGNIGWDPGFASPDDGDFHLEPWSPCVDAGDPLATDLEETDSDGEPRVQQCRVDMGIDESPYYVDCNANGAADACEVAKLGAPDCNRNLVPDDCELDGNDCNGDLVPDDCEPDCNQNGRSDECDIDSGDSTDCNANGIPDDCDLITPGPGPISMLDSDHLADSEDQWMSELITDGAGLWLAVWASGDDDGGALGFDNDLFYSISEDVGKTWTKGRPLNTDAATDATDDTGVKLATDRRGTWVGLLTRFGAGWYRDVYFISSTDNGQTWSDPRPVDPDRTCDESSCSAVGTGIATDGQGNWVALWHAETVFVSRSSDNGLTWSPPEPIAAPRAKAPTIATDSLGNWVAVWSLQRPTDGRSGWDYDLMVSRSTDNGASWTTPEPLNSDAAFDFTNEYAAHLATDRAGNWMALWTSDNVLRYSASSDAGATWTPVRVLWETGSNALYSLVVDPRGTWLALWISSSSAYGWHDDLVYATSTDAGASWSEPVAIDPAPALYDSGGAGAAHIETDGNGAWLTVWSSDGDPGCSISTDEDIRVCQIYLDTNDCNGNAVLDACEIADDPDRDCNANGLPDDCEADVDEDGVADDCDQCPSSDLRPMIVVGKCDLDIANVLIAETGCTLADDLASCGRDNCLQNPYAECVAHLANKWFSSRLISSSERGIIQRCAARAGTTRSKIAPSRLRSAPQPKR